MRACALRAAHPGALPGSAVGPRMRTLVPAYSMTLGTLKCPLSRYWLKLSGLTPEASA
jgi:hypothetical protein